MAKKPLTSKDLTKLKKTVDLALKKQAQDGLAKVFNMLNCQGVANQIKKGIKVTGNVEYGIRHCVHDRIGPRVNVETWKFSPQTKKSKILEKKFVKNANFLLKSGGFREMSPKLLSNLRKEDKKFEQKIKKRAKEMR